MANKTSLRPIARRISKAVETVAQAEGLPSNDYALVGTYDEKTERISLTVGTDRPIDERRWYERILQEIRRQFPEAPEITMYIGLVIRRVTNLDEVYWDSYVGENEIDMTELLERR